MRDVRKIAILGVGFMGGSLALALKNEFSAIEVSGYARSKMAYQKLKKLKILDRVDLNLEECVKDADLVAMAMPVEVIEEYFKKMKNFLKKGAIVFDLGSSKKIIEKSAKKYLPQRVEFVGCHPLCGSEKSGAQFSNPKLYQGELCLITSSSRKKAVRKIKQLWQSLGSRVEFVDSEFHDKVLSFVSHLPHLISFSLTHSVPKDYLKFSSKSFKDLTRISKSPSCVWAEIFLSNRANILIDLKQFQKTLASFGKLIKNGDKKKIINLINKINLKQQKLI